jgi:hypothetical protein
LLLFVIASEAISRFSRHPERREAIRLFSRHPERSEGSCVHVQDSSLRSE